VTGWLFIRRGRQAAHAACMVLAFSTSVLFLVSYLIYPANVGSVRFTGQGWIRSVYFFILITHTVLAALMPILAVVTLRWALKRRFESHRRIARWTLPVWLYVSATGVAIYVLLYHVAPRL
jgi:uncharacterized membrane protein YozB (DUF420 family)